MCSAAEDEDSQKRGVVVILWYYGPLRVLQEDMDPELVKDGTSTVRWIPIRTVGVHFCVDPSPIKSLFVRMYRAIGSRATRHLMRCHIGM